METFQVPMKQLNNAKINKSFFVELVILYIILPLTLILSIFHKSDNFTSLIIGIMLVGIKPIINVTIVIFSLLGAGSLLIRFLPGWSACERLTIAEIIFVNLIFGMLIFSQLLFLIGALGILYEGVIFSAKMIFATLGFYSIVTVFQKKVLMSINAKKMRLTT